VPFAFTGQAGFNLGDHSTELEFTLIFLCSINIKIHYTVFTDKLAFQNKLQDLHGTI